MRSDAEKIRALKERTGHSLPSCKLALREADGNYIRALEILRARTLESMKRAGGVLE